MHESSGEPSWTDTVIRPLQFCNGSYQPSGSQKLLVSKPPHSCQAEASGRRWDGSNGVEIRPPALGEWDAIAAVPDPVAAMAASPKTAVMPRP